jgi:hypothetical protein
VAKFETISWNLSGQIVENGNNLSQHSRCPCPESNLASPSVTQLVLVNMVMNLWVVYEAGSLLSSCAAISFSRRALTSHS